MKEIQVTQYQAEDGRVFKRKEDCLKYEERLLQVEEILEMIPVVKKICAEYCECSMCPFYGDFGHCRFGYHEDSSYAAMPSESWIN